MISLNYSSKLASIWSHLRWWLLYFCLTMIMNYLSFGRINLIALSVLIIPFVASFYSMDWILRRTVVVSNQVVALILWLLVYFVLACGIVYAIVYLLLPSLGIFMYQPEVPFNTGLFVSNMYRNAMPLFIAVVAHRLFILYREKCHKQLVAERMVSASLKKQLNTAQENRNLKQSLLMGQLGSHLRHNITLLIRQRMASDKQLTEMVEGLLEMQRYSYVHIDPQTQGILLEQEINYIQRLIALNQLINPETIPVDFHVRRPIVARMVPPFILSTILENAYKYADCLDPEQPIRLVLSSGFDQLTLIATNKVRQLEPSISSTGIGLVNIKKQLELLHPGQHEFEASQQGEIFQVRLVIHYNCTK